MSSFRPGLLSRTLPDTLPDIATATAWRSSLTCAQQLRQSGHVIGSRDSLWKKKQTVRVVSAPNLSSLFKDDELWTVDIKYTFDQG